MPVGDVRLGILQSLAFCRRYTYLLLSNDICIKVFYNFSEKDVEATDGRGTFKIVTHKIREDRVLILKKKLVYSDLRFKLV